MRARAAYTNHALLESVRSFPAAPCKAHLSMPTYSASLLLPTCVEPIPFRSKGAHHTERVTGREYIGHCPPWLGRPTLSKLREPCRLFSRLANDGWDGPTPQVAFAWTHTTSPRSTRGRLGTEADLALIREIDTNNSNTISLSEFLELSKRTGLSKVQMRARFRDKDYGNAGMLSIDQMREVLREVCYCHRTSLRE